MKTKTKKTSKRPAKKGKTYAEVMGDIAYEHNTASREIGVALGKGQITEREARDAYRYIDIRRNKKVNAAYKKLLAHQKKTGQALG